MQYKFTSVFVNPRSSRSFKVITSIQYCQSVLTVQNTFRERIGKSCKQSVLYFSNPTHLKKGGGLCDFRILYSGIEFRGSGFREVGFGEVGFGEVGIGEVGFGKWVSGKWTLTGTGTPFISHDQPRTSIFNKTKIS